MLRPPSCSIATRCLIATAHLLTTSTDSPPEPPPRTRRGPADANAEVQHGTLADGSVAANLALGGRPSERGIRQPRQKLAATVPGPRRARPRSPLSGRPLTLMPRAPVCSLPTRMPPAFPRSVHAPGRSAWVTTFDPVVLDADPGPRLNDPVSRPTKALAAATGGVWRRRHPPFDRERTVAVPWIAPPPMVRSLRRLIAGTATPSSSVDQAARRPPRGRTCSAGRRPRRRPEPMTWSLTSTSTPPRGVTSASSSTKGCCLSPCGELAMATFPPRARARHIDPLRRLSVGRPRHPRSVDGRLPTVEAPGVMP